MNLSKLKYILFFLLISGASFAQKRTSVKGIIVDSKTGEPLPFVTVVFDGTTLGVNTDFEGQYVIQADSNTKFSKLKVSYVGYKPTVQNVQLGVSQVINFKLQLEPKTLNEVTVKEKSKNIVTKIIRLLNL